MLCNSWIIVRISDGLAVYETWNKNLLHKLNTEKYKALTAYDYLCGLNKK